MFSCYGSGRGIKIVFMSEGLQCVFKKLTIEGVDKMMLTPSTMKHCYECDSIMFLSVCKSVPQSTLLKRTCSNMIPMRKL